MHFSQYEDKQKVEIAGLEAQATQTAGETLTEEQSDALEAYEKAVLKKTP